MLLKTKCDIQCHVFVKFSIVVVDIQMCNVKCLLLFPWEKINRELCFNFMLSNRSISHSHYSKTIVNVIPSKL